MEAQPASPPVKIFYCYADEDSSLQVDLERHLAPLRRIQHIMTWSARDISLGTNRNQEIEARLDAANIILLLISAHFFASDYWYNIAMKRALERDRTQKAYVIPIILRPVNWEDTPISTLSVLPIGKKAVTLWDNRDEAWLEIAKEIRKVVRTFFPTQTISREEISILYPELVGSARFPAPRPLQPAPGIVPPPLPVPEKNASVVVPVSLGMAEKQNIPFKPKKVSYSTIKVFSTLAFCLLVIIGSVLFYRNITNQTSAQQAHTTPTAYVQATSTANAQATSTAEVLATSTAKTQATSTAEVLATSTAKTQATSTANAQNLNPYGSGGTLVASDPMSGPGSTFDWTTGNDTQHDECSFKDGGYHVYGLCSGGYENTYIPAKFVFEIHLLARNCGELEFDFDFGGTGPQAITFYIEVCQNGHYKLDSLIDPGGTDGGDNKEGSTGSINTTLDQSNTIGVVADGSNVTLYINDDKINSISDPNTLPGTISLWGFDPSFDSDTDSSTSYKDYREVVYTDAHLWSL